MGNNTEANSPAQKLPCARSWDVEAATSSPHGRFICSRRGRHNPRLLKPNCTKPAICLQLLFGSLPCITEMRLDSGKQLSPSRRTGRTKCPDSDPTHDLVKKPERDLDLVCKCRRGRINSLSHISSWIISGRQPDQP